MFERERKLYAFNLGMAERLLADVTEEEFSHQPLPGMNPPRWILGHLVATADYGLPLLGATPTLPGEWRAAFGAGSKAVSDAGPRPTKEELIRLLREGHARFIAALDSVDEAPLGQPHGVRFENVETFFPTRGDLAAFLMTDHESFHIGQLSAWRRATGRKPLF